VNLKTVWAALATSALVIGCGSGQPVETQPGSGNGSAGKACSPNADPSHQGMPSEARIFSWIEDLVGIGYRRTGTPEGYAAAAYVKCQFESLGLTDVHYEVSTSWKWAATRGSVEIAGQPVDAFPSAFSFVTPDEPSVFSTGPGGLQTEVVNVGLGTPVEMALKDVKGKIVLFDLKFILPSAGLAPLIEFLWDPGLTVVEPSLLIANPYLTTYSDALNAAMDAGAAGFIGVLADYFESNQYYNEFYRRTSVTIPGFWVSPSEGERIKQLIADNGGSAPATMVMEGSRKAVEARSVVGFLEGKSKDTIMVQSHHDSVFYGAVEDGSGTASVLAQAQYFASQPPESREKTLMFATFDTHFTGYQGHQAFTNKYIVNKETPYNIVANVTLEHIAKQGLKGDNGELVITDQPELRAIMNTFGLGLKTAMINAIVKHDLRRTVLLSAHALCATAGVPTDASFVCLNGVPTASFIAGPNYLYDAADTLDKVDRSQLVPVAEAFAEIIDAIDATPSALIGLPLPALGPELGL
jgi:hypothetical protein